MTRRVNELGQPIGEEVPGWDGVEPPSRKPMAGRFCRIEPLDVERHLEDLFEAFSEDPDGRLWTYMMAGPFGSIEEMRAWMGPACRTDDPLFHALIDAATGQALGVAAYMRIKPDAGVIEIGSITFSTRLQRTIAATEAMFLMMRRAFNELGYRRCEWKCDALNAASRRAADRLGFTYDGLFRQALIYKGRSRDTAWYSIVDGDWPPIEAAFMQWLDVENFDENGRQKRRLQDLMAVQREPRDPDRGR